MATLFLHLNAERRDEAEWLHLDESIAMASVRHGPLSLAANDAKGARVIVFLPGADITLADAVVPTRNAQRIAAALPYLLEEKFASDVEDLHFAFSKPALDNSVNVAVIARDALDDWLQRLAKVGIRPHVMVPDICAVPDLEDTWSIVDGADSVLLRMSSNSGLASDRASVVDTLRLSLALMAETPPAHIVYYRSVDDELDPLDFGDLAPEVDSELLQGHRLNLLAKHYHADTAIDLLQGEYGRREQLSKNLRPWRATAVIAAICLVLFSGLKAFDYVDLKRGQEQLTMQVDAVYKRIFPQATGVASKERVQSLLKKLGSAKTSNTGFLELLDKVADGLKKTDKLEITRIDYRNDVLNLALILGDLQSLDNLKTRLAEDASLSIEIQSASSRNDKVEARLKIKGEQ
ncbi:MAG: type II secretion system protein GspL [Gammaproteobacteria bacterium]|nr:MAG: type II secretion system protein GspL [Gammaproteobacteria bacterium]